MCMISQADKAQRFLDLHRPGEPLLMPNPWDLGSAKLLASLGFAALATTSSGFAATLGRNDGLVSRDEAMIHAAVIVAATDLPVSADLENAYADDPAGAAETMRLAIEVGLAGASIEDFADEPGIYDIGQATERVAAAAEAAHAGPVRLVLTARAENFIRGNPDLADTIARLQAYQEAGADVLYAPGLRRYEDISQVVREVDRPVNVLALDDTPPVAETGQGRGGPDLGGRRVRVRRPGGGRRGRYRTTRTGNLRLAGGGCGRRGRCPPCVRLNYPERSGRVPPPPAARLPGPHYTCGITSEAISAR